MKNTVDAPTREKTLATASDAGSELEPGTLKMVLPSGRIQEKVVALLERVGLSFAKSGRSYRPRTSQTGVVAKFLKAQNIPEDKKVDPTKLSELFADLDDDGVIEAVNGVNDAGLWNKFK